MGRNEYEQFQRRDGGRVRGARPRLGKACLEDQVRDWARRSDDGEKDKDGKSPD